MFIFVRIMSMFTKGTYQICTKTLLHLGSNMHKGSLYTKGICTIEKKIKIYNTKYIKNKLLTKVWGNNDSFKNNIKKKNKKKVLVIKMYKPRIRGNMVVKRK